MTTFEALVSIAQTALRARGEWNTTGLDDTFRRDIRAIVISSIRLLRVGDDEGTYECLVEGAVNELERRATPYSATKVA